MSELYNIYLKSNFSLCRSIVLKSEATAESMNHIDSFSMEISHDPSEWRYYKNLAGEYHVLDEPMYVISADTKQEILFDKDILVNHPLTRTEYSRDGNLRSGLISRFPDNEEFIDRILDPIDKQRAINATDFEILHYDKEFVDDNEYELMSKLQEWIYNFTHRWNIPEMGLTDPLYPAVFIGILYIYMTVELVNIRLSKIFTLEANQWHIWQHLSSTLGIGDYRSALDIDSSIFLYKNINYIKENFGKEKILHLLDRKLLKPLGLIGERLDLVRYESYIGGDTTVVSAFNKVRLDDPGQDIDSGMLLTSRDVVKKTDFITRQNIIRSEKNIDALDFGINTSLSNKKNTNLVMVSELPNAYSVYTDKEQLRLDYWVYLCSIGRFNSPMKISVPGRGLLNLSPIDTFLMLLYSSNKGYREPNVEIPLIGLQKVILDKDYDYDYIFKACREEDLDIGKLKSLFLDSDVKLRNLYSDQDLFDFVDELSSMNFSHMSGKDVIKTMAGQGQYEGAIDRHYSTFNCQLVSEGTTFETWISGIDLVTAGLTDKDWFSVAESCLFAGTGTYDKEVGLSERHSNMVKLLNALTSYGLSVIPGESFSTASLIEYSDTTQTNSTTNYNIDSWIPLIGVETDNVKSTGDLFIRSTTPETLTSINTGIEIDMNIPIGIGSDSVCEHLMDLYVPLKGTEVTLTITENN